MKCIVCNKVTDSMYHFNEGLYCEAHKELGWITQKQNLSLQRMEALELLLVKMGK